MFVLSRPAGRVPIDVHWRRICLRQIILLYQTPTQKSIFIMLKGFPNGTPFFRLLKLSQKRTHVGMGVSRGWGGVSLFGCAKINLFLCFGCVLQIQHKTQCEQIPSPAKPLKKRLPRRKPLSESGGQNWNRTSDTRIFSPPLYQLSYLAVNYYSGIQVDCRNRVNSFFL